MFMLPGALLAILAEDRGHQCHTSVIIFLCVLPSLSAHCVCPAKGIPVFL